MWVWLLCSLLKIIKAFSHCSHGWLNLFTERTDRTVLPISSHKCNIHVKWRMVSHLSLSLFRCIFEPCFLSYCVSLFVLLSKHSQNTKFTPMVSSYFQQSTYSFCLFVAILYKRFHILHVFGIWLQNLWSLSPADIWTITICGSHHRHCTMFEVLCCQSIILAPGRFFNICQQKSCHPVD